MELTDIKGVGEKTREKLRGLGIFTVEDLLFFMPKSYFDMTKESIAEADTVGEYIKLRGTIGKVGKVARIRGGLNFFKARLDTSGGAVSLLWYNAPYLREKISENAEYFVWGKLNRKKEYEMYNPGFEPTENAARLTGIVPVYPLRNRLGQGVFRNIVRKALGVCRPQSLFDGAGLSLADALRAVHDPQDELSLAAARRRVATEELCYQLAAYRSLKTAGEKRRFALSASCIADAVAALPYTLTPSQAQALAELLADLRGAEKCSRMLIGDVGSGKTVVALLAMLYCVRCGCQSALAAPTEILAAQHFRTAETLLSPLGVRMALLTGSMPAAQKRSVKAALRAGDVDIVIGTHAVFTADVVFRELGFAVVDELHRFGVRQKSALEDKSRNTDMLIMSATPIPRALALGVYGDLSVSVLDKRRTEKIATCVVGDGKLPAVYRLIAERVACGEQAYIVCPLVEDSEGLEVFSAKTLFETLAEEPILRGVRLGLIYGGMREDRKESAMRAFYAGETDVLIATSVVEVGIDNPRASVMAVLNADRFGLAQLHQLRGRVGRSEGLTSYCVLHTARSAENERLRALTENDDGFRIAEIDAELRGYGDFLGVRQSGSGARVTKQMLEDCKAAVDALPRAAYGDAKIRAYADKLRGVALL